MLRQYLSGHDPSKYVFELGDYDGIGALCKAASVRLEPDGSITASEAQRFLLEGEITMQDLQSNALNFTVLFSLFLTISFALISQGVGSRQYPSSSSAADFEDAFGDDTEVSAAYYDLATYCYPHDPHGAEAMRRSFYAAEIGILCAAILVQSWGLFESFNLCVAVPNSVRTLNALFSLSARMCCRCVAFGGALPSIPCKYDFLLERPMRITTLYIVFLASLIFLMVSLPFICARASALASIGTFCVLGIFFFLSLCTQCYSTVNSIWAAQYREACRALAQAAQETQQRAVRAESGPLSQSGTTASTVATVVAPFDEDEPVA